MTELKIGFPLYRRTLDALSKFQEHLPPGAMADVPADPEEAQKFVNEWAAALIGVTLDAITDAASRWLRDPELVDGKGRTRIPTIASFGMYARRVDVDHYRPPPPQFSPKLSPEKNRDRIDSLGKRAREQLGSHVLAARVWDVLCESAASVEIQTQIRDGHVSDQEFDIAIEIVRRGAQCRSAAC